jgi:predicted transcriptional regulator
MKYKVELKGEYPLKEKRAEFKISLRKLSKKICVSHAYLHRLETGKSIASEEMFLKIQDFFDNA